jgi:hypothetical protein
MEPRSRSPERTRRAGAALMVLALVWGCGTKPATRDREPQSRHLSPAESVESRATPGAAVSDSLGEEAALAILRSYYDAIDQREYARAYRFWGGEGASSRQTLAEFRRGFAQTVSVRLTMEKPGRMEGAAGSRYLEIPVAITAVDTRGRVQHFRGTYTMRRSVVDGATPEQRAWRIDSATLAPTDR